jgi:hypothetical protein
MSGELRILNCEWGIRNSELKNALTLERLETLLKKRVDTE